jgi:hypothetical protein
LLSAATARALRARLFCEKCGALPAFFKVDIDSAYRHAV